MSQFRVSPYQRAFALAAALLALGGCTTRGSVVADRAQMQVDMARQDSATSASEADSRASYLRVVTQMQQKGLYFASLAHIDALQQRWGSDPESNVMRADAMRQTGQPEAAGALYRQLLSTPMKARAAHGLGLLAGRVGDLAGTVEYLGQATQAAPTDAAILNDLGYALMQQGKWKDARLPLMKASELNGDNPRIWSNVALYLVLDGQAEQAKAVMDSHQLSSDSRAQIAEVANTIQQRFKPAVATVLRLSPTVSAVPDRGQPVPAAGPAPVAAVSSAAAAVTTTPVLQSALGIAELPALRGVTAPARVAAQ